MPRAYCITVLGSPDAAFIMSTVVSRRQRPFSLDPNSKYKQLNGIDAKAYFEKAEKLFREMGLEHDLEELERVRLEM